MRTSVLLASFLVTSVVVPAYGQVELKVSEATPWTELLTFKGVQFSFIFYSEADNYNGGIVMRLENDNAYPVTYAFKVVFRSGSSEQIRDVTGYLEPNEAKTGSAEGLFWIPWEDQRAIEQVGLRGYRISRR